MPAKEKKSKSKASELRVVFDSSVIYTGSEADLVRGEAADLIRENTQHLDLSAIWYLPSVVRHERQSQMQKRALELLPSIQKLERLLGHQLNITEPIIKQRVNEAVETQIVSLGLKILELDQTKVDLNRLIHDACYRVPPFTDREKEKGFRDACIVETFAQLVEASPKTSRVCRVVIVTGDALVADAIRMRTSGANNVRILNSIEELKGLINTLVEQVREEFVKTYRTKAQEYFFEADREEGLFYKEKIRSRIEEKFKEHLESIPKGSDERKNGTWHIGTPSFVRKERQRMFWATRVRVDAEAYKRTIQPSYYSGQVTLDSGGQIILKGRPFSTSSMPSSPQVESYTFPDRLPSLESSMSVGSLFPDIYTHSKELSGRGESVFQVVWSVVVTTRGKLSSPRVESLEYVGTTWE